MQISRITLLDWVLTDWKMIQSGCPRRLYVNSSGVFLVLYGYLVEISKAWYESLTAANPS